MVAEGGADLAVMPVSEILHAAGVSVRCTAMASIRQFPKSKTVSKAPIEPLLLCTVCNIEMCLFGIESESDKRDLYTFECLACDGVEVRGVQVKGAASLIIPINE
jgi:hypothetical protein